MSVLYGNQYSSSQIHFIHDLRKIYPKCEHDGISLSVVSFADQNTRAHSAKK